MNASTTTEAAEAVAGRFEYAMKAITLYPRDHPRVREALRMLKRALETYIKAGGRAFSIRTDRTARLEAPGEAGKEHPSLRRLLQLLEMHLIEKLTIRSGVEDEEIFQLCLLLHEDVSLTPQAEEEHRFDPDSWTHVEVVYYRLGAQHAAFVRRSADAALPLKKESGTLARVLEELPEASRGLFHTAFEDPKVRERILALRKALFRILPGKREAEGEGLDVIEAVLKVTLESVLDTESGAVRHADLERSLENLLAFLENNADLVRSELRSMELDRLAETSEQSVAENVALGPNVARKVRQLQILKERLLPLFRTRPEKSGVLRIESRPEGDGAPAKRPQSVTRLAPQEADALAALEERIAALGDAPGDLGEKLSRDSGLAGYLQCVFELLMRPDERVGVRRTWDVVRRRLHAVSTGSALRRFALEELSWYVRSEPLPEFLELFSLFLLCAEGAEEVRQPLNRIASLPEGPLLARDVLGRCLSVAPERAPRLLAWIEGDGGGSLREEVRRWLLPLLRNPSALSLWAEENPSAAGDRELLDSLEAELGRQNVKALFREFFRGAKPHAGTALLKSLPSGSAVAETIVYAAMDTGSPQVRRAAIRELGRFPSDVALKTLEEVLRINNYRDEPDTGEVRAALGALLDVRHPRAAAVVRNVLRGRRWFRRLYKKEIRAELVRLVEGVRLESRRKP